MSHEARPQDQKQRPPMAQGKLNELHPAMAAGTIGAIRAQRPGEAPGKGEACRVRGSGTDARQGVQARRTHGVPGKGGASWVQGEHV